MLIGSTFWGTLVLGPRQQAAQPRLFMSKFVWRIFLCLLSSPGLFVYVLYQVLIPCTCCFIGDVMAGLLTPEERAAAASVRFGPGQLGPMASSSSEYRVFFILLVYWPVVIAYF